MAQTTPGDETDASLETDAPRETDASRETDAADEGQRGSSRRLWLGLGLLVAVVLAFAFLPVRQILDDVLAWVDSLGAWAPVAMAAIYIPASLLAVPGSVLTLGAGFLLGVWVGTIAVSIGSTLGAIAAFLVGRHLASDAVAERVDRHPRFRAIARALEKNAFKIVLLSRLSPIFPFVFLNYAYGLTRIRLRDYALASWIGMLPGTVMYVYLGSALTNLSRALQGDVEGGLGQQILFWGGLVLTVVLTVIITRSARRALRETAEAESEDVELAHEPDPAREPDHRGDAGDGEREAKVDASNPSKPAAARSDHDPASPSASDESTRPNTEASR